MDKSEKFSQIIKNIPIQRLQSEGTIFRYSQRFKKIGVPFINVSYDYEVAKDELSVGKLYVVYELEKWVAKIVNNPITGLKSIDYSKVTDKQKVQVAMIY